MRALQTFITVIVMVSILPWGPYAAAAAAMARAENVQSVDLAVTALAPGQSKISAPKRCRIAVLTGMGCGHDLAVLTAPTCLPLYGFSVAISVSGEVPVRDASAAPPRSPPRFF